MPHQKLNPFRYGKPVPPFGDEATNFHHVQYAWDSATQTLRGWVDSKYLGSQPQPLTGKVNFGCGITTDADGMTVDVTFDHFQATQKTEKPAPLQ